MSQHNNFVYRVQESQNITRQCSNDGVTSFFEFRSQSRRSRLGLEGFRSRSRALSHETLHELFFYEVLQEAAP